MRSQAVPQRTHGKGAWALCSRTSNPWVGELSARAVVNLRLPSGRHKLPLPPLTKRLRSSNLIATALVVTVLIGIGALSRGAFLRTSSHDANPERTAPSALHPTAAATATASSMATQVRIPPVAASTQRAEVIGNSTAIGQPLIEDVGTTVESLFEGLPSGAASHFSGIVRLSHCTTTDGHRWRTPVGAPHALRVVTIDCRPPELGEGASEEAQRRANRLSEYPLVFVARDAAFSEIELPGFMYQSGTIGSVVATTDGWPVFRLGGTVYECGEEDKDCQSEGELTVVFRDGKMLELPPAAAAESAAH
jgi:hypothetical protein